MFFCSCLTTVPHFKAASSQIPPTRKPLSAHNLPSSLQPLTEVVKPGASAMDNAARLEICKFLNPPFLIPKTCNVPSNSLNFP